MKKEKNTEQNSVKCRIKQFIKHIGLSQGAFEKRCGLSNGYINNIRKSIKSEKFDETIAIAFPELNKMWVLHNQGSMLNEQLKEEKPFKEEVCSVPFEDYMVVEYADLSTVAGLLGGSLPENLPETKKKLLPKEFEKGNYLVVKIDGDSMDDGSSISIPDGTEILIKEYTTSLNEKMPIRNNLFVIVSREGTVFKQIVEHNLEEGYIMCHSYNKKYKDYPIQLEDILQVFIYRKIVSLRPSIPSF